MAKQEEISTYKDVTLFREFHTNDNKVWGKDYEVEINYTTKKARVKINLLFPALCSTTGYSRWNKLNKYGYSKDATYEKHFYGLTVNGNKAFFYITINK